VYSNFNYVVAGLMLEQATGKSWETLIQQRLFEPVGMMHAGFGPPATPGKVDAPLGHESNSDPGSYADNPPALGPAGTVHASIGDLVAYARVYLDGGVGPEGRILSEEALTEMETPVLEHYGFGWFTGKTDEGVTVMRHNGSNTFFWALMVLYPERRSAVISMVNCGTDEAWNEVIALTEYFRLHFGLPETRPWEGE
jgi:CubicO group peptidase (beta-lactamase class C family)